MSICPRHGTQYGEDGCLCDQIVPGRLGDPENGPWCRTCNTYGCANDCPVLQERLDREVESEMDEDESDWDDDWDDEDWEDDLEGDNLAGWEEDQNDQTENLHKYDRNHPDCPWAF